MLSLTQRIKQSAHDLGFNLVGVTPAEPSPRLDAYLRWLDAGYHGQMGYMARQDRIVRRRDLNVILPGVLSMVVVGLDYTTLELPPDVADDPKRGRISNYAWARDYHDVMLPRLEELAATIQSWLDRSLSNRVYVDTGAILERDHAEQAGLGFVGKNTMLIHPRRGSYFFLAEILLDVELDYDEPQTGVGCGTCTRCLDACPTDAFPQPYVLDATRCISYLTIKLKGSIPLELRPLMGNWIYGCDVCQIVCPWQRFAIETHEAAFHPLDLDHAAPPLSDLLMLNESAFAARFKGSPIKRIGRDRLVRNACVAAGNSSLPELLPIMDRLAREDTSELVREHAAWAVDRLRVV
jgi:epoxyqueuosine reductase